MTSFDEAALIGAGLGAGLGGKVALNLLGWTKEGFRSDPSRLPVNAAIGGKAGLGRLAGAAAKAGFSVWLQLDLHSLDKEEGRFSLYNDVVKNPIGLVVTDKFSRRFALRPAKAAAELDRTIAGLSAAGVSGITLDKAGSLLMADYPPEGPSLRADHRALVASMLGASRKAFGGAAVVGSNAYAAFDADLAFGFPVDDGGEFFSDAAVPLLQMVASGRVAYVGGPANLSWDADRLRLKWIEYGYLPYYRLTWKPAELMKESVYDELFNSEYASWKDRVLADAIEVERALGRLRGMALVRHDMVGEAAARSTWEDGTRIYVNYGGTPLAIDGKTVGARSWLAVPGRN
jgi:hypothetical protein